MAFLTGNLSGTPGSTGSFVKVNHIGDVDITGDLTVTTLIATTTITTGDNIIVLNDDVVGAPSENAGIEVERGASTNTQLLWDETGDRWQAGEIGSLSNIIRETDLSSTDGSITFGAGSDFEVDPSNVDHDALQNFVADEHIAHSGVTLTAGDGLSGGGDISSSRTFDVDIANEAAATVASLDELLIADVDDSDNIKKVTAQSIADLAAAAPVTDVSNSDGSLTVSPTTGNVVASLNVGNSNTWTADQSFNDNVKVTLGSGGDADIYYDGTDLQIDPEVVGTGNVVFGGDVVPDGNDTRAFGTATDKWSEVRAVKVFAGMPNSGSSFVMTQPGLVGGGATGSLASVEVNALGGLAYGISSDYTGSFPALIEAAGSGAVAIGLSLSAGVGGEIRATNSGSFAGGAVLDAFITSSGQSSYIWASAATGATVAASGTGSVCFGSATTNNITASSTASFAFGDSTSGAIIASAAGAMQIGPGTNSTAGSLQIGSNVQLESSGDVRIGGALNHDGSTVGFYGTTPVAQSSTYTITNVSTDRAYDADATSVDELADTLGTLIADLKALGLIG